MKDRITYDDGGQPMLDGIEFEFLCFPYQRHDRERPFLASCEDDRETDPLPCKREVCGRCQGDGVHDHPAFSDGFTSQDIREMGPDFEDDYMRGRYDVKCTECKGQRVVWAIDESRVPKALLELIDRLHEDAYYATQEAAAERRMGC